MTRVQFPATEHVFVVAHAGARFSLSFLMGGRPSLCLVRRYVPISQWPVGLMDKASASGAGDSRFESWAGHLLHCRCLRACTSCVSPVCRLCVAHVSPVCVRGPPSGCLAPSMGRIVDKWWAVGGLFGIHSDNAPELMHCRWARALHRHTETRRAQDQPTLELIAPGRPRG